MLTLSVRQPDWQAAIQKLVVPTEEKIRLVLNAIGLETIAYLKSHTEERRPPAHSGATDRPAHPGHWADVTGQLVNSYGYEVGVIPGGARLALRNDAEYAVYLEARNGFFVLTGVTDPGGPVETALLEVAAKLAPEWTVRRG